MEEEKYYLEIVNHPYLTHCLKLVDIGNRFRNIQGMKQYWFMLFLLCVGKITDKNGCDVNGGRKLIFGDYQSSLLNSISKIGGYCKQIQKHTRNTTIPICIVSIMCWIIADKKKNDYDTNGGRKLLSGER